jgi:hypothetical protein
MTTQTKEPVSAAERMRRSRQLRRNRLRLVRALLHETDIDALIERQFLKEHRRNDQDAVENALNQFICLELTPRHETEA